MLHWFEGEITAYEDPVGGDPVHRATVRELSQGIEIRHVQMPLVSGAEILPREGSRIVFYRDTAATAKFGFLISDPRPIGTPISIQTANKAAQDGEPVFNQGEVALAALGTDDGFLPTEGAFLWLSNSGNGVLSSGSGQQRVLASDSSDSVDIEGTNIDIYAHGNLISTHFFNIDTALLGTTTLSLGLRNPITGVYVTRLKCDSFGTFTVGAEDPLLGSLLSGISYTLIPNLVTGPFIPEIKLTSVPLLSQLTVNPLGTTINGSVITIAGAAVSGGLAAPAALVDVSALLTKITSVTNIQGATSITGNTSITGTASITGATTIAGATTVVGSTTLNGSLTISAPQVFTYAGTPAILHPSNPALAALGVKVLPIFGAGGVTFMLVT